MVNQTEVAVLLGVDPSTVSQWCTGVRVPGAVNLRAISQVFGLPWTEVLLAAHAGLTTREVRTRWSSYFNGVLERWDAERQATGATS